MAFTWNFDVYMSVHKIYIRSMKPKNQCIVSRATFRIQLTNVSYAAHEPVLR